MIKFYKEQSFGFFTILSLLLSLGSVKSYRISTVNFMRPNACPDQGYIRKIVASSQDIFYGVGHCEDPGRGWVVAFDESGLVWDSLSLYNDITFYDADVSLDGGCVVSGLKGDYPFLHKYDPNGNIDSVLSADTDESLGLSFVSPLKVKSLDDGGYTLIGMERDNFYLFIVRISEDFQIIWKNEIMSRTRSGISFNDIDEGHDGSLIAVINNDYWSIEASPLEGYGPCEYIKFTDDGDPKVSVILDTDGQCLNAKTLSDGGFLFTGWAPSADGHDSWIYKMSSDEHSQWEISFNILGADRILAVNEVKGDIVLMAYKDDKFWAILLDSKGNLLNQWSESPDSCAPHSGTITSNGLIAIISKCPNPVAIILAPCPSGTYSVPSGLGTCNQCQAGTYQPSIREICIHCPEGTYIKSTDFSQCFDCPESCLSCTSETNCLTCYPSYSPYILPSGDVKCLDACPDLYYTNGFYCRKCSESCFSCTSGNICTSCLDGFLLHDSGTGSIECLSDCPDNYYKQASVCKKCIKNCLHCTAGADCSQCNSNYLLEITNSNYQCSKPCLNGYYYSLVTESCEKCSDSCRTCSISATNCQSCIGNSILDGSTNTCVACHPLCGNCDGVYYDKDEEKCKACNSLCDNCFGPSASECSSCSISSYKVENKPNLCVINCNLLPEYFREGFKCIACHPFCSSCFGSSENNCLSCKLSTQVLYMNQCLNTCPYHFTEVSGKCYECHKSCKDCINTAKTGCRDCQVGLSLYKGECLSSCPSGTYSSNGFCLQCHPDCKTCLSEAICTTCQSGFYISENKCIEENQCPEGTYQDDSTKSCKICAYECSTCHGPTSKDCKECNAVGGYIREKLSNDNCHTLTCQDGTYRNINKNKVECQQCHKACLTCIGPGPENCLVCSKGFQRFSEPGSCKTCEVQLIGYFTSSDGSCKEICGDGYNMGSYDCDDGNNIDKDGCSSDCKLEPGFRCETQPNGLDICKDITHPTASLSLLKNNLLLISFSKNVRIKTSSSDLNLLMNITLSKSNCKVNWQVNNDFGANMEITELKIRVEPECSLKDNKESFIVNFNNRSLVVDLSNNELSTITLSAKTLRYIHVPDGERATLTTAGAVFDNMAIVSFIAMLAISMLQSVSLGMVWSFVNMLQIISYIPVINCNIPWNLSTFLRDYLTIKKVVIPINIIPNIGLLDYLEFFMTKTFNGRFFDAGYESFSFIVNFSEEITTWILLLIFYLFLTLLQGKCFTKM